MPLYKEERISDSVKKIIILRPDNISPEFKEDRISDFLTRLVFCFQVATVQS